MSSREAEFHKRIVHGGARLTKRQQGYVMGAFRETYKAPTTLADPLGWVFQHEETGLLAFVANDGINNAQSFAANNRRHQFVGVARMEKDDG